MLYFYNLVNSKILKYYFKNIILIKNKSSLLLLNDINYLKHKLNIFQNMFDFQIETTINHHRIYVYSIKSTYFYKLLE